MVRRINPSPLLVAHDAFPGGEGQKEISPSIAVRGLQGNCASGVGRRSVGDWLFVMDLKVLAKFEAKLAVVGGGATGQDGARAQGCRDSSIG